jgi:EAL domain-containing protein (putative c-di-GMP-specific phosphodiesterase class I)
VVRKAEALIRWQHPDHGLIPPSLFIPIAEETDMIGEIGDWVFREAARQVNQWRRKLGSAFQISINKSPTQFYDEQSDHGEWFRFLQELGLPGSSIVVEITERLLLDTDAAVTDKLLALRRAGIQVSLDDFGTSYSSLAYLQKFDIDYIKIDQTFVRQLAPNSNDLALCEAIIAMSHKLGIKVVAEGVETPEQKELLLAANCDYGQGFLFSKPLRAEDFDALLRSP